MIQQGLIEKVVVPSHRKKPPAASVKCFRLVRVDRTAPNGDETALQPQNDDDDDKEDCPQGKILTLQVNSF